MDTKIQRRPMIRTTSTDKTKTLLKMENQEQIVAKVEDEHTTTGLFTQLFRKLFTQRLQKIKQLHAIERLVHKYKHHDQIILFRHFYLALATFGFLLTNLLSSKGDNLKHTSKGLECFRCRKRLYSCWHRSFKVSKKFL